MQASKASKSTSKNNPMDLFSYILSNNVLRSLPHQKLKKKLNICQLNSDIDLYTNKKIIDVRDSNYHVDHIFELQCFAHVISLALRNFIPSDLNGNTTFALVRDRLVKIINSDANLNVTDKQTNLVKMNVFKEYIKRRRNHDSSSSSSSSNTSLIRYLRTSPNFDKNISLFCSTLRNACKHIRDQLVTFMNESASSSLFLISNAIKRIIDQFDIFYNTMQIQDYDLLRYI